MERPDSSSDDEDDRQNLIEQNERKLPSPRSATTFHINDDDVDNNRNSNQYHRQLRRRFASLKFNDLFNKRFLIFFIFIPLFVLILFFTTDIKALFFSNLSVPLSDSVSDKLRESELRALYLLRQQQLGLFGLWNQTHPNSTSNHSNSQISELEDFKSTVLR